MQQSTSRLEFEDTSSEEPPRRRRLGRKRKRRPEPTSAEVASSERYADDYVRPHFDDFNNERQTSEKPKRRRKKIERRLKWADSLEEDRPVRKRGQRRKRPSTEASPEQSEFNAYRPNQAPRYADEEVTTDQVMTMNEDKHGDNFSSTQHFPQKQSEDIAESREEVFGIDSSEDNKRPEAIYRAIESQYTPEKDKSLSEFSMEDLLIAAEPNSPKYKESKKAQVKYLQYYFVIAFIQITVI